MCSFCLTLTSNSHNAIFFLPSEIKRRKVLQILNRSIFKKQFYLKWRNSYLEKHLFVFPLVFQTNETLNVPSYFRSRNFNGMIGSDGIAISVQRVAQISKGSDGMIFLLTQLSYFSHQPSCRYSDLFCLLFSKNIL